MAEAPLAEARLEGLNNIIPALGPWPSGDTGGTGVDGGKRSMSAQAGKFRIDLGEGVWADVKRDFYNPLVKRRELTLVIHHVGKPTPMRINIRITIAEKLGAPIQNVYVRSIMTEYGIGRSKAVVHIYDNLERALQYEPKHIIERNGGVNPFEEE